MLVTTAALVAAIAIVGSTAGCQESENPGIATAGGTPTASANAAASDVVTEYVEGVRTWVACLRAEGVKVSDPDPKGQVQFEGDPKVLKSDPKWIGAQKKCTGLHPVVPEELVDKPKRTPEEIDQAVRYAKCMRANGAPDFPDPDADGYYPMPRDGEPGWNQGTPAAIKAGRTCDTEVYGLPATPGPAQG